MAKDTPRAPSPDEPLDPLVEEAVSRLLHLHSGEETEEDWAAYQAWKETSAAHHAAAEHAEAIWDQIGAASSRKRPRKPIPVIVAAALALTAAAFALGLFGEPRAYFADYTTAIGEQKTVILRDGSTVDLDSGTSFDLGADGRSIQLYAGQIFLSVESSPSRPFRVQAAGGTVQTLGTKFGVRRDADDAVTTFVTENAVRISYAEDPERTVDVRTGQVASYSPAGGLLPAKSADIRELTAWQRGELSFKDQTLSKVVSELERYRRGRIILIGDVRALRVTGVFDIHDPAGALDSLSLALPISVHQFPGLTVITAASERHTPALSEKK